MSWFRPLPATTSRRRFLGGGAVSAVGLAVLGLGSSRLGRAPGAALAQTAPWSGGDVPVTSRSSSQMAAAARAFLDSLAPDQLVIVHDPDLSDQTRTQWTNFPAGAV